MVGHERIERLTQLLCRTYSVAGLHRLLEWTRRFRGVTIIRVRLRPSLRDEDDDGWTFESLRDTLCTLKSHYRFIPFDDVVAAVRGDVSSPPNAASLVISLFARPPDVDLTKLLAETQAPCLFSIVPGLLERGTPPWPLMVRLAIDAVNSGSVDMYGRRWALSSAENRSAAVADVVRHLYAMPDPDRLVRTVELVESWGVRAESLPGLKWYEVEVLARSGYPTFGVGGLTGDSLIRLPLDRAAYEIREARSLLRERLDAEGRHFEYPFAESSPILQEQVVRAGYLSALVGASNERGMNRVGEDTFGLRWFTLKPGTPDIIRADLSGVLPAFHTAERMLVGRTVTRH